MYNKLTLDDFVHRTPEEDNFLDRVIEVVSCYKQSKSAESLMDFQNLEKELRTSEGFRIVGFTYFYEHCGFLWEKGEEYLLKRANVDEISFFLYWSNYRIKANYPHWKEGFEFVLKYGSNEQKALACTIIGHHLSFEIYSEKKETDKHSQLQALLQSVLKQQKSFELAA